MEVCGVAQLPSRLNQGATVSNTFLLDDDEHHDVFKFAVALYGGEFLRLIVKDEVE